MELMTLALLLLLPWRKLQLLQLLPLSQVLLEHPHWLQRDHLYSCQPNISQNPPSGYFALLLNGEAGTQASVDTATTYLILTLIPNLSTPDDKEFLIGKVSWFVQCSRKKFKSDPANFIVQRFDNAKSDESEWKELRLYMNYSTKSSNSHDDYMKYFKCQI